MRNTSIHDAFPYSAHVIDIEKPACSSISLMNYEFPLLLGLEPLEAMLAGESVQA